jgi:hypothetical protein
MDSRSHLKGWKLDPARGLVLRRWLPVAQLLHGGDLGRLGLDQSPGVLQDLRVGAFVGFCLAQQHGQTQAPHECPGRLADFQASRASRLSGDIGAQQRVLCHER